MFAVPGWNVGATVATLTPNGADGLSKKKEKGQDKPAGTEKARASLKRKLPKIDDENVEAIWGHVVEGKSVEKPNKKIKKRQRHKDAESKKLSRKEPLQDEESPDAPGVKSKPRHESQAKEAIKSQQPPKAVPALAVAASTQNLTPLQASMRAKLTSARFRHLNEQLYTKPSSASLSLFSATPSLFEEYHSGFRQQVAVWPENPVDGYVTEIQQRATIDRKQRHQHAKGQSTETPQGLLRPLPSSSKISNIADLGCGDARLAHLLSPQAQKLRIKIHSFDLHSPSPLVTRADISSLPLPDSSIDISIFCLALMGTNWLAFIDEAYRITRWGGELWVAEIKSRFARSDTRAKQNKIGDKRKPSREEMEREQDALLANTVDGAPPREETNVSGFVAALRRRGFLLAGENSHGTGTADASAVDMSNKMFVKMKFLKAIKPTRGKNFREGEEPVKAAGNGHTERFRKKKKGKFIDDVDEVTAEDEAKLLKPCVYKLR